jgi:hypothetical protein
MLINLRVEWAAVHTPPRNRGQRITRCTTF